MNEATFRCADEMGWQPQVGGLFFLLSLFKFEPHSNVTSLPYCQQIPIVAEDGEISRTRQVRSHLVS